MRRRLHVGRAATHKLPLKDSVTIQAMAARGKLEDNHRFAFRVIFLGSAASVSELMLCAYASHRLARKSLTVVKDGELCPAIEPLIKFVFSPS